MNGYSRKARHYREWLDESRDQRVVSERHKHLNQNNPTTKQRIKITQQQFALVA